MLRVNPKMLPRLTEIEGSWFCAASAPRSGQPVSLKLEDLDVICVALGCEISDLLIPEPEKVGRPKQAETERAAVGAGTATPAVIPKRRDGRSLPPA